LNSFIIKLSIY